MKYCVEYNKAFLLIPKIGNAAFIPGIEDTMVNQWYHKRIKIKELI